MATTDIEVTSPPTDGISALAFSSQADYLASSSWDNQVRVYEVQPSGQTIPKAAYAHEGPVLDVTWSQDGTKVISCGADKAARMYDLATGQATQIAAHGDTIKAVRCLELQPTIVATGSWDKTIKYWDIRAPSGTPATTAQLPERLYSMDSRQNLLVAGTADRHIVIYDLSNPSTPYKTMVSPLKWQTRSVACFTDGSGFGIGSIEGRTAIHYIQDKDQARNFVFKSHRDDATRSVYSCNQVAFHPTNGATFVTCGSDGAAIFWNRELKRRNNTLPRANGSLSAACFNKTGTIFAYAISYDWLQGHKKYNPNAPNRIMLHPITNTDMTPQPK
ncbi:WD40-repeat-containing domain protein [Gongronella butleri]|nr:WD40-repeat-containing domain protein [Gongronella butleri]